MTYQPQGKSCYKSRLRAERLCAHREHSQAMWLLESGEHRPTPQCRCRLWSYCFTLHCCQGLFCALGEMGQPATMGRVGVPRSTHRTWGIRSTVPQVPSALLAAPKALPNQT